MKRTCNLSLSSETYGQNVEIFLTRKPFLPGHSAIDSDGTADIISFPRLSVFTLILLSF